MAHKSAKYDAAPDCGLFIRLSDTLLGMDLVRAIREIFFVINHGESAYKRNSHILYCEQALIDSLSKDQLATIVTLAKSQGIVVLLENNTTLAGEIEAEGVLLDDEADILKARQIIGEEGIIGLRCGIEIDRAEAAIEKGADFVSFHTQNKSLADPKIAAVWSTLSDMPCVMEGPFSNDYVSAYVQAGTNFIDAGDYILNHKKGVKQGTVNIMHAIELALDTPRSVQ